MTTLIKIGNSQGIRIPKALIEQAKLQDCEIALSVVKNGLLLEPKKKLTKKVRENWDSQDLRVLAKKHDEYLQNLSDEFDANDIDTHDWEW